MKALATRFLRDESGATAVEYGLIAGLIAVATIAALLVAGGSISKTFNTAANALPTS